MQGRNNRIMTYSWISNINYIVMHLWKCDLGFHGMVVSSAIKMCECIIETYLHQAAIHNVLSPFHICRVLGFFSPTWYFKNILTEWDCFICIEAAESFLICQNMKFLCVCGLAFCKSVISPGHLEIKVSLLAKDVLIINHFSAVILIF